MVAVTRLLYTSGFDLLIVWYGIHFLDKEEEDVPSWGPSISPRSSRRALLISVPLPPADQFKWKVKTWFKPRNNIQRIVSSSNFRSSSAPASKSASRNARPWLSTFYPYSSPGLGRHPRSRNVRRVHHESRPNMKFELRIGLVDLGLLAFLASDPNSWSHFCVHTWFIEVVYWSTPCIRWILKIIFCTYIYAYIYMP